MASAKPKPGFGNIFKKGEQAKDASSKPAPKPDESSADARNSTSTGMKVRALYSYTSQYPDELTFSEGDMITVLTRSSVDDGWWTGQIGDKVGIFPATYVEFADKSAVAATPPKPSYRRSMALSSVSAIPNKVHSRFNANV